MDLSKDEVGGLIEAENEYVEGFLSTLLRATPQNRMQIDDLRAKHLTLMTKLRAELRRLVSAESASARQTAGPTVVEEFRHAVVPRAHSETP